MQYRHSNKDFPKPLITLVISDAHLLNVDAHITKMDFNIMVLLGNQISKRTYMLPGRGDVFQIILILVDSNCKASSLFVR